MVGQASEVASDLLVLLIVGCYVRRVEVLDVLIQNVLFFLGEHLYDCLHIILIVLQEKGLQIEIELAHQYAVDPELAWVLRRCRLLLRRLLRLLLLLNLLLLWRLE